MSAVRSAPKAYAKKLVRSEGDNILSQLDEELGKREKLQEDANKNMGTFGKSVGGLGDVLDKVGGGKFIKKILCI